MFLYGSIYQPDYILDKDIILVTFNYRLGPLGDIFILWKINVINTYDFVYIYYYKQIYFSIKLLSIKGVISFRVLINRLLYPSSNLNIWVAQRYILN